MKKRTSGMLIFSSALFLLSSAYAAIPNTDDPVTFLGPTLRLGFTNNITDTAAYSLGGQAGSRNYRLDAVLGTQLSSYQRIKISGEYIRQNIAYAFFDGNTDQWVQQGVISADFQYDLVDYTYSPQLTLNAYYSQAPNKSLRTDAGYYTNASGVLQSFTEAKRIAGSNAGGISPGVAFAPWQGGKIALEANFDAIHYDTEYTPSDKISGAGGTVSINQYLSENVSVNAAGAFRQPYINYQGSIVWNNIPCYGNWNIGLQGEYTRGKNTLPDTYNVGITADYFLGQIFESPLIKTDGIDQFMHADERSRFSDGVSVSQRMERQDFLNWTAKPAVYMPQVLAIADSQVS